MSSATKAATGRKIQAEATRLRLLESALSAFTARPYDAVSMGDIADAAGTAHGLPFHYFGSKRGLYIAALRSAVTQLLESHQVDETGTPREQIKAMLVAHFMFMRRHAALAMALLRGGIGADPQAWQIFEDSRLVTLRWMCEVLGLDPEHRALMIMMRAMAGAIDEATVQWVEQDRTISLDVLVDALLDLLVSTLKGANRLDAELDVEDAVRVLREE